MRNEPSPLQPARVRLEARVSRGRAGRSESIGPLAWEALGRAFEAAARHSPMGLPRFAIDDHVLMLVGLPVDAEVDGASLALPLPPMPAGSRPVPGSPSTRMRTGMWPIETP